MKKSFIVIVLAAVLAISVNVFMFAAEESDAGASRSREEVLKEMYGLNDDFSNSDTQHWIGATYLGPDGIPVADLSKTSFDYSDPRIEGKWFYHMFVGTWARLNATGRMECGI